MKKEAQARGAITIGLTFLVLGGLAGYAIYEARAELEDANLANDRAAQDIARLKERADQRDKLVKKLEELQLAVKEYVKILPSAELATEEELQRLVSQRATQTGVSIQDFKIIPVEKPRPRGRRKKARAADPFNELELRLELEGGFAPFVAYLNLLEKDERFLKVTHFRLAEPDEQGLIKVTLWVSSFSYKVAGA